MERIIVLEGKMRKCGDVTQISDVSNSPGQRAVRCLTETKALGTGRGSVDQERGGAQLWVCRVQGIHRISLWGTYRRQLEKQVWSSGERNGPEIPITCVENALCYWRINRNSPPYPHADTLLVKEPVAFLKANRVWGVLRGKFFSCKETFLFGALGNQAQQNFGFFDSLWMLRQVFAKYFHQTHTLRAQKEDHLTFLKMKVIIIVSVSHSCPWDCSVDRPLNGSTCSESGIWFHFVSLSFLSAFSSKDLSPLT